MFHCLNNKNRESLKVNLRNLSRGDEGIWKNGLKGFSVEIGLENDILVHT